MEVLGIIPARGGSKGVPGKNVRLLAGKPLIAHSVEAARHAKVISRVVVSSDSEDIMEVGRRYGAETPLRRAPELAADTTPMHDVVRHALETLRAADGYHPDWIVLLQPTSPFRRASHIDDAFELLQGTAADSLTSVCLVEHSPYWMRTVTSEGYLQPILEAPSYTRRQDLPPVYRLNGALYVTTPALIADGSILGRSVLPYVMTQTDSIDIDTELDFALAEVLADRHRDSWRS